MKTSSFNRLVLSVFSAVTLMYTTGCDNPSAFQADEDLFAVQSSPLSNNSNGRTGEKIPGQLIVTFKQSVANPELTARGLASTNGGEVLYTYTASIKGFTIRVPDQTTERVADILRRDPNVEHVEQDGVVYAITTQSPATWGLDRVDQRTNNLDNSYTYNQDGTGVSVYVVDTGIRYSHVDFGGRAVFGYDAIGGLSDPGSDCNGHGTHVAGTAGSTTWGVAKNATLVSVRVLGCNGSGSWSGVLAGIDWITKNGQKPGVVNMSLGASGIYSTLENAITNSINAGFTYAIAAGNSNADACDFTPARTPAAITVGSTTSTDARSSFSNYGSCVDLFAPGSSINSTYNSSNTSTTTLSGTSMASPHVAGVAALYLQANPSASASEVRDAIVGGATQGIVTSSLTANNHLLYSLLTGTPPPPPPADDVPPSIDVFNVTNLSGGRWTEAQVDWSVSDNQGLASVRVELMNGSSVVVTSTTTVSGTSASGSASPRTRNSADSVRLTVTDAAGNVTSATKSINDNNGGDPEPPPPGDDPISLSASGFKVKGFWSANLTWSGATSSLVDVKRNGTTVATVSNSGSYTYDTNTKGSGSMTLQVCEAGTTTCSNIVTVTY